MKVPKSISKSITKKNYRVLVTGDVIVDHYIYKGARLTPDSKSENGSLIIEEDGGARLLHRIIEKVSSTVASILKEADEELKKPTEQQDDKKRKKAEDAKDRFIEYSVSFGLKAKAPENTSPHLHSYALWTPELKAPDSKEKVLRMTLPMGYGSKERKTSMDEISSEGDTKANILVLDDASLGFRSLINRHAWPAAIQKEKTDSVDWVILKMSSPVASGDLFRLLSKKFMIKLVLVVSIGDLRREEVGITKGLSWERTAQELLTGLHQNAKIKNLLNCRHLIVTFGSEGALWISRDGERDKSKLIFDPDFIEGEFDEGINGRAFGYMSCLVAGIVNQLVMTEKNKLDLGVGIISGLSAMRVLNREGHGPVGSQCPQFPYDKVTDKILSASDEFSMVNIPALTSRFANKSNYWTILEDSFGCGKSACTPLYGLARLVALYGTKALSNIPFTRFGNLFTVDRSEIESLRGIRRLIKDYVSDPSPSKPLSLAVFGAPGSGKSFGIKQIAKAVLGKNVPILEFNLSQFTKSDELTGAFHQVRDMVLQGLTPVVFWDEFDSKEYTWLQYLLAPMQDGVFREGQLVHPVGKCIFVFAGGTSYKMENFAPSDENSEQFKKFKLVKGPDFVSRLSGYLNVLGPNKRQKYNDALKKWEDSDSPPDICFPIRRALLIRSILKLFKDEVMYMDKGLLTALLEIKEYSHGARSLETIIKLSRNPKTDALRRSDIPPENQMSLHVNYKAFMQLIDRDLPFKMNAEILAPAVHECYRRSCRKKRLPIKYDLDYAELPEAVKDSNIAAAERIPEVLSLADLVLVHQSDSRSLPSGTLKKIIANKIEVLSEVEHNGWMEEKYKDGYSFGSLRDDDKKIHPSLVPYPMLKKEDKDKDRDSVKNYPEIARLAGYKVVRNK